MLATELSGYEKTVFTRLTASDEVKDGVEGGLSVLDYKPKGRKNYFYNDNVRKSRIVLHFTMGFLGGDLSTLTKTDNHVSVSFVIARDGRIYRIFDTSFWSYHLGRAAIGGNKACSSTSIGIEISNIGPLDKSGDWMWNAYGSKYCRVAETQFYASGADYRGYRHFATFTDAQYDSVRGLLQVLTSKHGIPTTFIAKSKRFSPFAAPADGAGYKGICSHVNYRATGKVDIGPMFEWDRIGA